MTAKRRDANREKTTKEKRHQKRKTPKQKKPEREEIRKRKCKVVRADGEPKGGENDSATISVLPSNALSVSQSSRLWTVVRRRSSVGCEDARVNHDMILSLPKCCMALTSSRCASFWYQPSREVPFLHILIVCVAMVAPYDGGLGVRHKLCSRCHVAIFVLLRGSEWSSRTVPARKALSC